ncbi:MAG: hypothetical protein QXP98_02185 [Thermoproteus sp.]
MARLARILAIVFGSILMVLGALVVVSAAVFPAVKTSVVMKVGGAAIVKNSSVLAIQTKMPARISISAVNAYFKVAMSPTTQNINGTMAARLMNLSEVPQAAFAGNYTTYTADLGPGYQLLIWPYKIVSANASLSYEMQITSQQEASPGALLAYLLLAVGVLLIAGGALLALRFGRRP